jgi:hypothetical protein
MTSQALLDNNMEILNQTDNLSEPFPNEESLVRNDIYADAKARLESEYGISL